MFIGKLLGVVFGYMIGGVFGAILGGYLGHSLDKFLAGSGIFGAERMRVQSEFFNATFSVMGHIAKADGHVSRHEIELAEAVIRQMRLGSELETQAKVLFGQGKEDDFDLDQALVRLRQAVGRRPMLLRMFLEIQIQAALADGVMHDAERRLLLKIFAALGFSAEDFSRLEAMIRGGQQYHPGGPPVSDEVRLSGAYQVLGVTAGADEAAIKKAYRRLMSQHHPDKLVSKGLPEEMIRLATEKTHEIRAAYDEIRKARGF